MRTERTRGPWIGRWWRGELGLAGDALSLATLPLGALFRLAQGARSAAYGRGLLPSRRSALPVVSVGNLVVGGTGKTPVTSWVAARLHERGLRPAILLRGYGRDEVLLHRRWTPEALVVVGADRVRSAREAERAGAEAIVLDDGFQHRRLARDLDLVLVAAEHPFPGRILPRGPYREPAGALARADLVVVTRRTAGDRQVEEALERVQVASGGRAGPVLRLAPAGWTTLEGRDATPPVPPLFAVTSVAGPELFRDSLASLSGEPVALLAFPDHHEFDEADARRMIEEARGRVLVVTEKDAVKLAPLGMLPDDTRVLVLSVEPERDASLLERAIDRIAAATPRAAANPSGGDAAGGAPGGPRRGGG